MNIEKENKEKESEVIMNFGSVIRVFISCIVSLILELFI